MSLIFSCCRLKDHLYTRGMESEKKALLKYFRDKEEEEEEEEEEDSV